MAMSWYHRYHTPVRKRSCTGDSEDAVLGWCRLSTPLGMPPVPLYLVLYAHSSLHRTRLGYNKSRDINI